VIYFMQPTDGGPVKIGTTDDLVRRHKQLEAKYECPLEVLATIRGGRAQEAEIHARFAHLRLPRTELFRPEPELMEFISRPILVGANVEMVEAKGRDDMAVKIARAIVGKARAIALDRGISIAEYLSEKLDGPVSKDFAAMLRANESRGDAK
jgi:hypothetical protein